MKIQLFGNVLANNKKEKAEDKKKSGKSSQSSQNENLYKAHENNCIIMPDHKYILNWNIWISILLIYTAIAVPVKVAFVEKESVSTILFDTFIDASFLIDCVL
jgi:hypothetical protein